MSGSRSMRHAGKLAALAAALLSGCSSGSSPTAPVLPAPTPGPTGSPGASSAPVVLTSQNHPGWGQERCETCHVPGLLRGHAGIAASQCAGCHGGNGTRPDSVLCTTCHGNPPATGAHTKHLALGGYGLGCASCHAGAGAHGANAHLDGIVQVRLDGRFGGSYEAGSCTGTFCHGSGRPVWARDTSLDCARCHEPGSAATIGARSGKHASHSDAGLGCGACHAGPPSGHWDGTLGNPDRVVPDGGTYRDRTPSGHAEAGSSGTCSGMGGGCHGLAAEWTTASGCEACHGASAANPPGSGSHLAHGGTRQQPCTWCHAAYPRGHLDGQADVAFAAAVLSPSGSFAAGRCSGVYCHGQGQPALSGGRGTTPAWGDPSTTYCGSCHGTSAATPPASGSHGRHAGAAQLAYPCEHCHDRPESAHGDFRVDVRFRAGALPGSGSYAGGGCSVYCHGGGRSPLPPAGGSGTPVWGDPASVSCGSCHGAPGAAQAFPPSGQHEWHMVSAGSLCDDCHRSFPAGHVDGARDVVFPSWVRGTFTRAPLPNEGTCENIACHSNPGPVSWKR